jgi:hypothetical protein
VCIIDDIVYRVKFEIENKTGKRDRQSIEMAL